MKQDVLTNKGPLLLPPCRTGERKRKSVRGCIVDLKLSALPLIVIYNGVKDFPGSTDTTVPRCLGHKHASNIRKLYNLTKEDDVHQFVVKRPLLEKDGKKAKTYPPKIQRLITPVVVKCKRHRLAIKKRRFESRKEAEAKYMKILHLRRGQERIRCRSRLSSMRDSRSSVGKERDKEKVAKKEAKKEVKKVTEATKKSDKKTDAKKSNVKNSDAEKKTAGDKKGEEGNVKAAF